MANSSDNKPEATETMHENAATKNDKENDKTENKTTSDVNEKNRTHTINTNTNHLSSEHEKKYVQESYSFTFDKSLFAAPKFHPYFMMKNYTVHYMDPIIKKAKAKKHTCCCN
ncbi:conserved Plasmodium protein, unknown function [Plasmodium sp. gorilla clade G3]|nr:conserved Plasmodium protein, unknown function [Plasmodium sp. gorilla clade G3]